jgi:hypothetical protein
MKEPRNGRVGVGSRPRITSSDTNLLGPIDNGARIYSITIKNSKTEENRHHNEEIYIKLEGNCSRTSKGNC